MRIPLPVPVVIESETQIVESEPAAVNLTGGDHAQMPDAMRQRLPERSEAASNDQIADSPGNAATEQLAIQAEGLKLEAEGKKSSMTEDFPSRRNSFKIRCQQAAVLEWEKLGGSVWSAAILADVPICQALGWLDEAEKNPESRYREFARQINKLEAAHAIRSTSTLTGCCGTGLNGHANGDGHCQQLAQWSD